MSYISRFAQASILFFFFLAITNINGQILAISKIPFESLTWILSICLGMIIVHKRGFLYKNTFTLTLLNSLALIALIIFSDLINGHYLLIFSNQEFMHLSKFLVLAPFIFIFFNNPLHVKRFAHSYIFFYLLLAFIFLYRFLVLNEVRSFDGRPTLNIRHGDPNFLSTFFTMLLPITLLFIQRSHSKILKYLFCVSSLVFIICNFLTQSRAGIISMILSLIFLIYLLDINKKIKKYFVLTCIFLFSIFVLNSNSLLKRYSSLNDKSNIDRVSTYINGLILVRDNPFFGTGFHQAKEHYYENASFFRINHDTPPLEIHNTYLEVVAEIGILGFLPYLLMLIFPINLIYKNTKSENQNTKIIGIYSASSFLALLLCSFIVGIAYKDLFILHLFTLALLNFKFSEQIIEKHPEVE